MRSWMVRRSWMVGLWGGGLLLAMAAHGESQRDLRVIGVIDEPNRWLDSADKPVGIDVDILAELMQRLGLHYQLVLTSSALRALDSCQQPHPSVDMYLTLSYRPEREAWLLYPTQSHISFRWNFFALQEALPRLHFDRYEDLKGLRIGVTKGRHDPCVGIRAVPIAEAMLALVLMDHLLRHRAQNLHVVTTTPHLK